MKTTPLLAMLFSAACLVACQSTPTRTAPTQEQAAIFDPKTLYGQSLQAIELDGQAIPAPPEHQQPITLILSEQGVSGYSGCNGFGGQLSHQGNQISISQIFSTMRACMDGYGELEHSYTKALTDAVSIQKNGARIELRDAKNTVRVAFKLI
ncbi:MAG: META domain-containing protein [Pseudomonadota bacterium]|nr:META domain-containing protein [Pseudomonadota bacterium]